MNRSQAVAKLFTSGLNRFSNRHDGQSCYVFGDGPSVKWFDLDAFADLPAFCCGMMPFHRDFEKLDVRYVSLVEPWFFAPRLRRFQPQYVREMRGVAEAYENIIRTRKDRQFFINLSNKYSLSADNVQYVYHTLPKFRNATDEGLKPFNLFAGSFHASLTLAYWMGFTTVYLVGFDAWTIQPSRATRWYEHGPGEFFDATNTAGTFLEVLRRRMDIYTVAMDGRSSNAKWLDYRELTGRTPTYRENDELMDRKYLDLLAECSDLRIAPRSS